MLFCRHRVNDPAALREVPHAQGVEIDLRSEGGRVVLEHDPFLPGPDFRAWLDEYRHAFINLNNKKKKLEQAVTRDLRARGIEEWAFLDQSFPFLVRSLRAGETRSMVRLSEFEPAAIAAGLPVRPQWVWVDSFTGAWPTATSLEMLAELGFRFMVVSPELQGREPQAEISAVRARFAEAGVELHGVCSKRPDLWL